jgi:hypothetical protein
MDEPVRSRLRTTRHRGLTSPNPVTAPQQPPAAVASTFPQAKNRTSRRTCQRQDIRARQ